jgi:predicted nucleic acid-binding Zn ribbon protein
VRAHCEHGGGGEGGACEDAAVGKASDWLREERRKVLGDWTAICLRCGAARRWFEDFEDAVPATCAACGGEVIHRCAACSAPISSTFAVDCEQCGARLREPTLFGVPIRREGR